MPERADSADASASTAYTCSGLAEIVACWWMLIAYLPGSSCTGRTAGHPGRHQATTKPNNEQPSRARNPDLPAELRLQLADVAHPTHARGNLMALPVGCRFPCPAPALA